MMENQMSKEADALLLKLLASRIDAAGAHCSPPPGGGEEEGEDEPEEECPDDEKSDTDTKIRFL
jgi:hypothetical protein